MRYLKLSLSVLLVTPAALVTWVFYVLPFWGLGLIRFERWAGRVAVFRVVLKWRWWKRYWDGWGGHSVAGAVVLRDTAPARSLVHELRHAQQRASLGILYEPVYGLLLAKFGYDEHPFERDARAHAELYADQELQ